MHTDYDNVLPVKFLVMVAFIVLIILLATIPKIYLASNIYYESRKIDKLITQYDSLKEENKILKRKVEAIRVKSLNNIE